MESSSCPSGKGRRNTKNTATIVWLQIRCAKPLFPSYSQMSSSRASSDPNLMSPARPEARQRCSNVAGQGTPMRQRGEWMTCTALHAPRRQWTRQEIWHSTFFPIRERISNSKRMSPGTSYKKLRLPEHVQYRFSVNETISRIFMNSCMWATVLFCMRRSIKSSLFFGTCIADEIQKILTTIQNQLLSPHQEERFGLYGQLIWQWRSCTLLHTH